MIEPGQCLTNGKDGPMGPAFGYKYQCGGYFHSEIVYESEGAVYAYSVPAILDSWFGDGYEPYKEAKVMACCGEYDDAKAFEEQKHIGLNCIMDARQQACLSMVIWLGGHIKQVSGSRKTTVTAIRDYIKDNLSECMAGLGDGFPSDLAYNVHSSTWYLPTLAAELDLVVGIWDVHAPATPELCNSLTHNDGNVFSQESSPLAYTIHLDLDEADGDLLGPVHGGGPVTASAAFASMMTSCSVPSCSYARCPSTPPANGQSTR